MEVRILDLAVFWGFVSEPMLTGFHLSLVMTILVMTILVMTILVMQIKK